MASGTGGWNAGAYGDDGWNDGIILSETGIAATLALGTETASGSAQINQVGFDNLRLSLADLSANISGTAVINTVTGTSGTGTSTDKNVYWWAVGNDSSNYSASNLTQYTGCGMLATGWDATGQIDGIKFTQVNSSPSSWDTNSTFRVWGAD